MPNRQERQNLKTTTIIRVDLVLLAHRRLDRRQELLLKIFVKELVVIVLARLFSSDDPGERQGDDARPKVGFLCTDACDHKLRRCRWRLGVHLARSGK